MSDGISKGCVLLSAEQSASAVLHEILLEAATAFPEALSAAEFPTDPTVFRKTYPGVLPVFEAARLASDLQQEIAQSIVLAFQSRLIWQDATATQTLQSALQESIAPLPLEMHAFSRDAGWAPALVYRGQRWSAHQLAELGALLVHRNVATSEVEHSLRWIAENILQDGAIRLTGRKIVVLGGGAEMAPTRFWLQAGADVLWLDTVPPPTEWFSSKEMSGRLFWTPHNIDLLTQPREVLATILAFADGSPVDMGLYAYAPGQARELRLSGVMNALVNALPSEQVASITMLVSPTTPTGLTQEEQGQQHKRLKARPAWEGAMSGLGLLGRQGGYANLGTAAATRTVVAIQGASYQAAQYIGKVLVAECWAGQGVPGVSASTPMRVSANTAAITRTRSLNHPVFAAAFGGAQAMGVETLTPRQSRRINGLLALRDWMNSELPVPGRVRVHGGIHTLPYPLNSALRVAAGLGFARSPRLLGGLFKPNAV